MKKSNKTIQTSFIKHGNQIFELAGTSKQQYFVEYDHLNDQIKEVTSVHIGETEYLPPQNELVASGTIRLPTEPLEYGSEKTLFEDVYHFINKYVDIPKDYLMISTLYVILSWTYDCFEVIPYLRVIGEYGTGKSRFLKTVGSLCYKATFAGGATTSSPIFRIIEMYKGVTLVLDEADFRFSGPDADIVKILNCGYTKGIPVLRTEGDGNNRTPKSFNVYGPKILATRQEFSDVALESRCLTQTMAGKPRKDIPRHLPKSFEDEALELRNKLLMFRLRNYFTVEVDLSLESDKLESRLNQVALPVLSVIEDEEIQERVMSALLGLQNSLDSKKQEQQPAIIIRSLLNLAKEKVKPLYYKGVAKEINSIVGVESDFQYEISPSKIGRINNSALGLETYQPSGSTAFKLTVDNLEKIVALAERYSIENVDDVDLVDQYFGREEVATEESVPEEVAQSLL